MTDCSREADVLEAVALDRLGDVRPHLDECATCGELALVASALRAEGRAACRAARVPSAGLVWWRATIRARADAARTAERPISAFEAVAAAAGIGLTFAVVGSAWSSIVSLHRMDQIVASLEAGRSGLASMAALVVQHAMPYALALALCLVLTPLALYFAFSEE
jgi:hypothetical protein